MKCTERDALNRFQNSFLISSAPVFSQLKKQ